MDAASWGLVAAEALFVVVCMIGERREDLRLQWIGKPTASLLFVLVALDAGALSSAFGLAVLAALVLSLAGDVFLVPRDERLFRVAIVAFLVAHLAYIGAFALREPRWSWALVAGVIFGALAAGIARWVLPHVPPALMRAVAAYMIVITVMAALAFGAAGGAGPVVLALAAVLFFASDILVARHRFVKREFTNRLVGLPLYYASQTLFALSVA